MEEAEKYDPGNIFTQFYVFKISVIDGDTDRGINVIFDLHLTVNTKTI